MDCSLPGSSVHGILQARILEWIVIAFSRGSSWLRYQTQAPCIAGRSFTVWAIGTAEIKNTYGFYAPNFSFSKLILLKTPEWFYKLKLLNNALADLLGLDAVDNGVHERWDKQIHIWHEEVYSEGQMLTEAVHKRQANHGDVEEEHSTDMGDTGVKGPKSLMVGGNA